MFGIFGKLNKLIALVAFTSAVIKFISRIIGKKSKK